MHGKFAPHLLIQLFRFSQGFNDDFAFFTSLPQIRFVDNTDPAGIDHQIAQLGLELASTLVIVISKVCIEIVLFFVCLIMML